MDVQPPRTTGHGITRRQALRRGAAVAGAVAWLPPVVQLLEMTPASAESASAPAPPQTGPPTLHQSPPPPSSLPRSSVPPPGGPPPGGGTQVASSPTTRVLGERLVRSGGALPFTGAPVNPILAATAGAAAVAAGASVNRAARQRAPRELLVVSYEGERYGVERRHGALRRITRVADRRAIAARAGEECKDPSDAVLEALARAGAPPEAVIRVGRPRPPRAATPPEAGR